MFSHADETVLKKTMLPRAPTCFFTKEDVEIIMKETKLDKGVIEHWAYNLRWRMSINKVPNILEFLKAPEPQVIHLKLQITPQLI
jgi:hypothetical protein